MTASVCFAVGDGATVGMRMAGGWLGGELLFSIFSGELEARLLDSLVLATRKPKSSMRHHILPLPLSLELSDANINSHSLQISPFPRRDITLYDIPIPT